MSFIEGLSGLFICPFFIFVGLCAE